MMKRKFKIKIKNKKSIVNIVVITLSVFNGAIPFPAPRYNEIQRDTTRYNDI